MTVRRTWRRWADVVPWETVVSPAGALWVILPNGVRPERIAVDWTTQQRRVFSPPPGEAWVEVLEPELPDAVAVVSASFPGTIIMEATEPGQATVIGPDVEGDRAALIRHLQLHHGSPVPHVRHADRMDETFRYHNELHRQGMVYPPRERHWHAPKG